MAKRALSLILSIVLAFSGVLCLPIENKAASSDTIKGKYMFYDYLGGGEIYEDFEYSDQYFSRDSEEFNISLALISLKLDKATFRIDTAEPENRAAHIAELLEQLGFSDVEVNEDFKGDTTGESACAACAHKEISIGGKKYTLLVITTRGGTYQNEWTSNMYSYESADDERDNAGYRQCKEKVLSFARDYIKKHDLKGDAKVWTTGYSRGAGIIDLTGADIIRDPKTALGDSLNIRMEDVYCYTFGTPGVASVFGDHADSRFARIHNVYEDGDLGSAFPPGSGFARYGTQYSAGMNYGFYPKKINLTDLSSGELLFANDKNSYLPYDQGEYLKTVTENIADLMERESGSDTDGRKAYYSIYQDPVRHFTSWAMRDGLGSIGVLTNPLEALDAESALPLMLSMYMSFMLDKSIRDGTDVNEIINQAFNTLALVVEDENGEVKSEFRQIAPSYKAVRSFCFVRTTDEETGESSYVIRKPIKICGKQAEALLKLMRKLTARLYAKNLRTFMESSGAEEADISMLTSEADSYAMSWLFTNMLLGNTMQSDNNLYFSLDNEQFKQFATFLGNMTNMLVPHLYPTIQSYLNAAKAASDDYADDNDSVDNNEDVTGNNAGGNDNIVSEDADSRSEGANAPEDVKAVVKDKSIRSAKNVSVYAAQKSVIVKWEKLPAKQRKTFNRVEVQVATDKKFRNSRSFTVPKSKSSYIIKGLRKGKTYYVRVRNIRKTERTDYVSGWSKIKVLKAG